MKQSNKPAARVANAIAAPAFNAKTLKIIEDLINPYFGNEWFDTINQELRRQKLREITIADASKVAYVHCRSVKENNGYSPVDRCIKYPEKADGSIFNRKHIKVITDQLLEIEFMFMLKDATFVGKEKHCRQYKIAGEVLDAINNVTPFPNTRIKDQGSSTKIEDQDQG